VEDLLCRHIPAGCVDLWCVASVLIRNLVFVYYVQLNSGNSAGMAEPGQRASLEFSDSKAGGLRPLRVQIRLSRKAAEQKELLFFCFGQLSGSPSPSA